jgi:nucleotide-binding universal stress UspA family protein
MAAMRVALPEPGRTEEAHMFKTILVPIDFEQDGSWERALEAAFALARANEAELHIMHVIRSTPAMVAQYLPKDYATTAEAQTLATLKEKVADHGIGESEAKLLVRHGEVYPEILDAAKDLGADLIVLGAHRPEVTDYLLGTTAARVARHAKCSVFLVRY